MVNKKRILVAVALIIFLGVAGFTFWAYTPSGSSVTAIDSMRSSETVDVNEGAHIVFKPDWMHTTGFIFYPGGHVDAHSYAPLAHAIAEEGYLVVIAKMPFNLAVFNKNAALKIIEATPSIENWVIGGHSLGGAMAASLVYDEPELFKGLVLLASYPPENNDLSTTDIQALTIYGSNDGLATAQEIQISLTLLPTDTVNVLIDGGNHAQFGDYGLQTGDGTATITHEEQREITVTAILGLLERVLG
jgi:dienelactone hydrolase